MNDLLQEAGCETIFEESKLNVESITQLADLQLTLVGGGIGNVLWG